MTWRSEHSARTRGPKTGLPRDSAEGAKAGYSFAEVLVVLAVIALIAALVPMGVSRMLPGARLASVAQTLAGELRQARADAVATGSEARYRVTAGRLAGTGGTKSVELAGAEEIEYWGFDSSGHLTRQETFRFLPDGSSTGGHFLLRTGNREWRVAVHWLFGHVEVLRGEEAR